MIDPANLPGKRILLVDDSKSARFVLRALLQKHGFTVDLAESAEVALEMIQKAPPDAVFMDHMMPGMDGHAATVALKADPATAHIPIVMCTSNDRPEHLQKAKELGALGILPKPPTAEKLSEILAVLDSESTESTPATPPTDHPAPESLALSMAQSQELQTTLKAMLPPLIEETLTPLIKRLVKEHWQTTGGQESATDMAQIEAVIEQRLEAGKLDWLTEIADSAERQVVAESVSAEQRLEKTLVARLAAGARANQDQLRQFILADEEVRSSFNTAATSGVEQLATAIAQQQASEVAQKAVEGLVPPLVAASGATAERQLAALRRRIGSLAAATVVVGLIGAAALYLSVTG